jgi:hypothetical protein
MTATAVHHTNDILAHCKEYSFPGGTSFVPEKIQVSERHNSSHQGDGNRLCVLSKDRLHYKVFTIPAAALGDITLDEDTSMF